MKIDIKGCMLWFYVNDFLEKVKLEIENRLVGFRVWVWEGGIDYKRVWGKFGGW